MSLIAEFVGQARSESIAIVGSACRFPGSCSSPSKLWDLISKPRDVLCDISTARHRFNQEAFYHPNGMHHGTSNVKSSYLLEEDPRLFDANFFSIKPVEAHAMDPQQRFLLETVYEAIESGGMSIQELSGTQTAVYVGQMWADYDTHVLRDADALPTYTGTGTARSILSNRLSHFFDWHGPSVTLDTACSSSLVAVHDAVSALRNGDATMAVAAGANMILTPEPYIGMSNLKMISPESRSRMWDAKVQGYARGEGVAALVLKKLSDAIRDGDHIECIIREVGVNQDGRTKEGITMPSQHAQRALIERTYAKAGLDPKKEEDRCQFFEAHGTGTAAGDPREAEAIAGAFFGPSYRGQDQSSVLYVGSIKTVIGHTEGTAGIAGIMKASLALRHGTIPPNLLFEQLSPKVAPFYHSLEIPTESKMWPGLVGNSTRRASVNSFGFGGTNAHVILEAYLPSPLLPELNNTSHPETRHILPFVFSASSVRSLESTVAAYADHIDDNPSIPLADLAYTLACRRSVFPVRASFSAAASSSLADKLRQWVAADAASRPSNSAGASSKKRILGIFTGQGAQWPTMSRGLFLEFPRVRRTLDEIDDALQTLPLADRPQWTIAQELAAESPHSKLGLAEVAQPLCTAVQILLVDLLAVAGISFHTVVGHSSGEIGAAYAAGFLSARDAIRIAYYRGLVLAQANQSDAKTPRGGMMAITTSYEDAQDLCSLDSVEGRIQIAAINSSSSLTLSGDVDAIEEVRAILEDEKKFARKLHVDQAYHSHHMVPYADAYVRKLQDCGITVRAKNGNEHTTWISSVKPRTRMGGDSCLQLQYWADNMVNPVLFSQAVWYAWENAGGVDAVIEVGPHPALKGPVSQTLSEASGGAAKEPVYVGLLSRGKDDVDSFSSSLGVLWQAFGQGSVDFGSLDRYATESAPRQLLKDLPAYRWDHEKAYWHETRQTRARRTRQDQPHDLLGMQTTDGVQGEMRWSNLLRVSEIPWVRGHILQGQIVFPATGYIVTAMEAALRFSSDRKLRVLEIRDFDIHRAMALDETHDVETLFALTVQAESRDEAILSFKYHACIHRDATELTLLASGSIQLSFQQVEEPDGPQLGRQEALPPNLLSLDPDKFYAFLKDVGYDYDGSFRGIRSIRRKLNYGSGSLSIVKEEWGGPEPLMAPAFLDQALQAIFVGWGYPGDGSLLEVHVPVRIGSIKVDVAAWTRTRVAHDSADFVSTVQSRPGAVQGDVGIFCPRNQTLLVQLEGVAVVSLAPDAGALPRQIYTRTSYWPLHVDSPLSFPPRPIPQHEMDWAWDLERVSLFYTRRITAGFPPGSRDSLALPHHKFFFDFADDVLSRLDQGSLPYSRHEWLSDTESDIEAILSKHPGKADGQLLRIVGENLAAAMRGETNLLQHMFSGDTMDRFYVESLGFDRLMEWLGEMAAQITRIHPTMKMLELGAGTGAATKSVFKHIGDKFSTYTYTDISPSFFEQAAQTFPSPRVVFKVLDLEKDVEAQGFQPGSYDLIVASNVLHATRRLDASLRAARRLLKPGGYLLVCEMTTPDVLRVRLSFSGLAGWWLGRENDDGRPLTATIDTLEWDERLRRTGFSGVDAISDESNVLALAGNVMVSQAVDERVDRLRDPLATPARGLRSDATAAPVPAQQPVVIVGGLLPASAALAGRIACQLAPRCSAVLKAPCLEAVAHLDLPRTCGVVNLSDLDKPALQDPTEASLSGLKRLFEHPRTVLWVTNGCADESPFQNMSLGLGRVLMAEMPAGRLQFLDFGGQMGQDSSRIISASYLRWRALSDLDTDLEAGTLLWSREHELVYDGDGFKVPRIAFDEAMNTRYMASRRPTTREVAIKDVPVALGREGATWAFTEQVTPPLTKRSPHPVIRVVISSLAPCFNGWHMALGEYANGDGSVIALTTAQESILQSPAAVLPIDSTIPRESWPRAASLLTREMQVAAIMDHIPYAAVVLLWEPPAELAARISERQSEKRASFVFLTSSKQARARGNGFSWTSVGDNVASKQMRHLVPGLEIAAALIDCSSSPSLAHMLSTSGIDRVLPPSAWRTSVGDIVSRGCMTASDPVSLLRSAQEYATGMLGVSCPQEGVLSSMPLKACGELNTAEELHNAPNLLVDWQISPKLTVGVSPVDQFVRFSGTKTYVLFGLTSDLGQSIAEWLATQGARHIALASRNPRIAESWTGLMSAAGVDVKVFSSDITSEDDVRRTINDIGKSMPPVGGVANGAMVLEDRPFAETSLDQINRLLGPKVKGTLILDSLFQGADLDFFILFSSIACMSGNRSQGIYSAANMFMAALAARRRKMGLPASVMHIGAILGVGYMSRSGENSAMTQNFFDALWQSGVEWLSERDLHNAFGEAVLAGRPELGLSPEFSLGLRHLRIGQDTAVIMSNPRFAGMLVQDIAKALKDDDRDSHSRALPVKVRLQAAHTPAQVEQIVRESVVAKMKSILQLEADKPEGEVLAATPEDLGTDSLVTVELRNWFAAELRTDVPVLKLLGGITIGELVAFVIETLPTDLLPNLDLSVPSGETVEMGPVSSRAPSTLDEPGQYPTPPESSHEYSDDAKGGQSESSSVLPLPTLTSTTPPTTSIGACSPILKAHRGADESGTESPAVIQTFPLSFGQSRFWFLHHYLADRSALNATVMARLEGALDVQALSKAVARVTNAHEALRTAFTVHDGTPVQQVLEASPLALETRIIQSSDEAYKSFRDLKRHDYDLRRGETMKIDLLSHGTAQGTSHFLLIGYHHINMDGISLEVLLGDIQEAYNGGQLKTPIQYTSFSEAQRLDLENGKMAAEKKYWTEELRDTPPPLPVLPTAESLLRQPLKTYASETARTDLSTATAQAIRSAGKRAKASAFHFLVATYGVLLHRMAGISEVCIGMVESGREFGRYSHGIGLYVNLLPLRLRFSGTEEGRAGTRAFESILAYARLKAQKAIANSRLPFNEILSAANVPPSDLHSPIFQAMINYRPGIHTKRDFCNCSGGSDDFVSSSTAYDFSLDVIESHDGVISLHLDVQKSLYSQQNAQMILNSYVGLLEAFSLDTSMDIASAPLYSMSHDEVKRTLQLGRGPEIASLWENTLVHRLDTIAAQKPNAAALVDDLGRTMTYQALMRRVQTMATEVMRLVGPDKKVRIGVYCKPSFEFICSMLAILRTGSAYVPLDTRLPAARVDTMVKSAGLSLVLFHQDTRDMVHALKEQVPAMDVSTQTSSTSGACPVPAKAELDDVLAVLYTSGTTGSPKCVELTHRSILGAIEATSKSLGAASTSVLQQTAVGFDLFLMQVLVALCSGGKLVVVPQEKRLDPAAIAALVRDEEITMTCATPSEYAAWLQHGKTALASSRSWRAAVMVGELYSLAVDEELRNLQLPRLELINGYGPTEASMVCTWGTISSSTAADARRRRRVPPAGQVLPNVSVTILDELGNLLPAGAVGEVFIGGVGVTRGYLHDPELTAVKFTEDRFATARAARQGWTRRYASGDRGKFNADGKVVILGRIAGDTQIKIRGMRTELREVELAVETASAGLIEQVVVTPRGEGAGLFLVAHATLSLGGQAMGLDDAQMARHLQARVRQASALPVWMYPAAVVPVSALPLTMHGKVDRPAVSALPITAEMLQATEDSTGSLTYPQSCILEVWSHVLGGDRELSPESIGPDTEFFGIGGTSIQLIGIRTELNRRFQIEVSVMDLFKSNTLASMAALVFEDTSGTDVGQKSATAFDWKTETMPPTVTVSPGPSDVALLPPVYPPQIVVLTGGSSFIGKALLEELVESRSVRIVHCLAVREVGRLGSLSQHPKIRIHAGDLSHPTLSLTLQEQELLARTADLIIHNGADVSFLKGYTSLRNPNVGSTRFLVSLAAHRRVPFHYVSSAAVGRLLLQKQAFGPAVDTRFPAASMAGTPPEPGWSDGYTASKWASEVLLEQAAAKLGLPVVIHRLSSVTGNEGEGPDASSGAMVHKPRTTDVMVNVVAFSLRLGAVPDPDRANWRGVIDFVSVGRVAEGVLQAAGLSASTKGKISPREGEVLFEFQSSEELLPIADIAHHVARRLGRTAGSIEVLEVGEWATRAVEAGMDELVAVFLRQARNIVFQELVKE